MFRAITPVATGTNPVDSKTADLDGDGHLDLLVTNYISDNVSVLFGNGDGTFTAGTPVSVGNGPREVAVGFIDGDGDLDFITANYSGNSVSVLLNNGSGGFVAAPAVPVGTVPRKAALGDLDGDGDLDLVSANYQSNTLSVMLNNGSGGFTQATGSPIPTGGTHPVGVVLFDFDGDHDLDIAVANNSNNNVALFRKNGSAGFTAAGTPVVGAGPRDMATADIDGDGDLDLLIANFGANTVSVLRNDGTGAFTALTPVAVANNPYDIAVGDLDGDGDLDMAVANSGSASVTVLRNDGSGGFTPVSNSPFSVGVSPGSISMGDYDEDGDLDLAVTNFGSNTVSILINKAARYSVTSTVTSNEGTPSGPGGEIVFTITRTATSEAETVNFTLSGTATAGTDYTGASGTAIFAAGQKTAEINIPITADSAAEFDETVTLALVSASGDGIIEPAGGDTTATINNDDLVSIRGTKHKDIIDADDAPKDQPLPSAFDDDISGRGGNDRIHGLGGDDTIGGDKGKDKLFGGDGGDRLLGGYGKNTLAGEAGADTFVFDTKIGKGKDGGNDNSTYMKVVDFTVGEDGIELSQAIFKKLDPGFLTDTAFRDVGEQATEDTRIAYKANGDMTYDKDGKGGADAIVFAKLLDKPDIAADDLLVVA